MKKLFISGLLLFLALSLHGAEQVRVGIDEVTAVTGMAKKDYVLGMNLLMNEFLKKEDIESIVTMYNDPKLLAEDFKSGKINMIASNAINIIDYIPRSSIQSGITGYRYNKNDNQTLLVLTRSQDRRPIEEIIKGVVASDGDKIAELYFSTLMLQHKAVEPADYLTTKNGQQSILKLYFKRADIALVDRGSFLVAVELNPALGRDLKILKSIPLTLGIVTYARKDISPQMHKKIIALAQKINTTPRGKQLMQMFRADKMDESRVEELDCVYALKKQYETLRKNTPKLTQGKK